MVLLLLLLLETNVCPLKTLADGSFAGRIRAEQNFVRDHPRFFSKQIQEKIKLTMNSFNSSSNSVSSSLSFRVRPCPLLSLSLTVIYL